MNKVFREEEEENPIDKVMREKLERDERNRKINEVIEEQGKEFYY